MRNCMANRPQRIKKVKIGKYSIGDDCKTFIIAEAGSNHNRNLNQAKKLIEIAAEAGADAIKFQLFKARELYSKECGFINTSIGDIDLFDTLIRMELPISWLTILKRHAQKCGILFFCSPFSEKTAQKLHEVNIEAFKIASSELNHLPLLEFISKFKKPMILSCGLAKLADIEEALDTCRNVGNEKLVLLHCVSSYPASHSRCNLNIIKLLKMTFGIPVGFSDHTTSPFIAPSVAVAVGADVIEKHFTINKRKAGLDHYFALEPIELKQMIKTIREVERIKVNERLSVVKKKLGSSLVEKVLGNFQKKLTHSEQELYYFDRRSIRVIRDIRKGEKLKKSNIAILRSERNLNPGIHPRYWNLVLGKRANKMVPAEKELSWKDILNQ